MDNKTAHIPTKVLRKFAFVQIPSLTAKGVETEEYRHINGKCLIPVTQSQRFCDCSKRTMQNWIKDGELVGYNANGTERRTFRRGSKEPLYFDLHEWLEKKEAL